MMTAKLKTEKLRACLKNVAAGFPACRRTGASSPADPALKLENRGKSSVGPGGKMPPSAADRMSAATIPAQFYFQTRSHPDISHPQGRSAGLQPAFGIRKSQADNLSALQSVVVSSAK